MSLLRTCGLRIIQTAGAHQVSAKCGGEAAATFRCRECQNRLSLLRSECMRSSGGAGKVLPRRCLSLSSKSVRLSSNKPYLIVVREMESPHAVLEEFQKVLDVRIDQLLQESTKHAELGKFYSLPAINQVNQKLSIESKRTKRKKKESKSAKTKPKSSTKQSVQSKTVSTATQDTALETKLHGESAEQRLSSKSQERTSSKTQERTKRVPKSSKKSDASKRSKIQHGATLEESSVVNRTSSAPELDKNKDRGVTQKTEIQQSESDEKHPPDEKSSKPHRNKKTKRTTKSSEIRTKDDVKSSKTIEKVEKRETVSKSEDTKILKLLSKDSKQDEKSKLQVSSKISEQDKKSKLQVSSKISKQDEKSKLQVSSKVSKQDEKSKLQVSSKVSIQDEKSKLQVSSKEDGKSKLPATTSKAEKRSFYILKDKSLYLEPFLEVCIFSNLMQKAISELNSFKDHMTLDVDIYNMLLMGLSQKGALGTIRTLFNSMAAYGIKPNAQSYAAVLQCIGRLKTRNNELIASCLSDMSLHKITVDDLFLKSSFSNDDREVMVEVIHSFKPKFIAPRPPSRPQVTNNIIKDLYQDEAELSDGQLEKEETGTQSSLGCLALRSKEELHEKFKEQITMEIHENVDVKSIEEAEKLDPQVEDKRKMLRRHKEIWRMKLVQAIKEEKHSYKRKAHHNRSFMNLYYPFLNILTEEELADLLLLKVFDTLASSSEGMSTIGFARMLGELVHRKFVIRSKIKRGYPEKLEQMYDTFFDYHMNPDMMQRYKPREYWQQLEDEMLDGPSLNYSAKPWKGVSASILGVPLANLLLRELRLDMAITSSPNTERKLLPAFYNVYMFKGIRSTTYMKPHPLLIEMIEGAKEPDLVFESTILPMVVPPVPWNTDKYGGYLLAETKIARCPEGSQQDVQLQDQSKFHEWYPVMDSLNQLAAVPWIVNKPMLDVIISVFKNGGSKLLNIPQPVSALPPPPSITSGSSKATTAQLYRDRSAYQKLRGEMHSLRMTELYKLSIANKFRDEVFWFPHNMDFRGRTYPCPPHFNHLGNDISRSILLFAKGRPLGEKGLDWLKIHLVNLTGFLKRSSQQDRLQYAEDRMELILDSADRPLEGKKWWQGADKQWQSLAACMEIANATRSENPAEFISHFPVHQDGSCNGLQHYAALGRDTIGAQQVNLHPYDVPQDVYSGVAELVEKQRAKDAANGHEIAGLLEGHVERKVVKQTVMTIVYGVTAFGAKLQILKQLREKTGLTNAQKTAAAKYLATAVFDSLQQMFTKTREIQHWLTETARFISKAGHCVDWVTPLGFPVTQPYVKMPVVVVGAEGKSFRGLEDQKFVKTQIDTNKQRNGFAPNFVHSLDSTHMMLTSLYCQQAGISYVSVHDCYWTHASTVESMNKICREQFVKLHEQPILHELSDFLMIKYGHIAVPKSLKSSSEMTTIKDIINQVPDTGDFNLKNVLESTYFFS